MSNIERKPVSGQSLRCELQDVANGNSEVIGNAFVYRHPESMSIESWTEIFKAHISNGNPPIVGMMSTDQRITQVLPSQYAEYRKAPAEIRATIIEELAKQASESSVVIFARQKQESAV